MRRKQFSDAERHAVFTVHGERCYMCGTPLDLLSMEVDHILPASLADEPDKLRAITDSLGLPYDFGLESFANWMPACSRCNNRKSDLVFEPTPIVQVELQKAAEKAARAAELAGQTATDRKLAKAWNTIKRGAENGELNQQLEQQIREFSEFHNAARDEEMKGEPIHLTPLIEVLSDNGQIRVVRGPFGVGGGPSNSSTFGEARCGVCGHAAWNGVRCVVCGEMSDD